MEPTFMVSLKIWWSMTWRGILAMLVAMIGFGIVSGIVALIVALFGLSIHHVAESLALVSIFIIIATIAFVFLVLGVYRWVLNRLPGISYREGRVDLMKDSVVVGYYGLFDALCIYWSFWWRTIVLGIVFALIASIIMGIMGYLGSSTMVTGDSITVDHIHNLSDLVGAVLGIGLVVIQLLLSVFVVMWMLARKKTGRWLRISSH